MPRCRTEAQKKKDRRRVRSSKKQAARGIDEPRNPNRYEGDS
jgi:hypothetical protein